MKKSYKLFFVIVCLALLFLPITSAKVLLQNKKKNIQTEGAKSIARDHPTDMTNIHKMTDPPTVELLAADYNDVGVALNNGGTHIPRLIEALKEMHARDFLHQIWRHGHIEWPTFQEMAPVFQEEGIRLWLCLAPPSMPPKPKPFEWDYVRWAVEVAKIAKKYPIVQGLVINDFNGNISYFTIDYCKRLVEKAREIYSNFKLLGMAYFGHHSTLWMDEHIRQRVLDSVILAYFYPHCNHVDTKYLRPQIETKRAWLDSLTSEAGVKRVPMSVLVYAYKHGSAPADPKPEFVQKCLEIAWKATEDGLADGTVAYCVPKNNKEFKSAVASVYKKSKK